MSVLSKLKVFATKPHPCSYQEDKEATTLFIDPETELNEISYQDLTEIGFRRSGTHFYRPHCQSCNDCIPARIPVNIFTPARRQKRIENKNKDLTVHEVVSITSEEHYQLYASYIELRHDDGDMYPPTPEQYEEFLGKQTRFSRFTEFRLNGILLAVSIRDNLTDSFSAIYTFFDPEYSSRSLGSFAVLWLISEARREKLDYVYLGYWIRSCRKMSYKIDYRPIELLLNNRWQTLN
ncbi:MAG: arginyltransferase [Cellvibrionales bacterium]|nr:arginyltransferase [Cellvibrionales bacterium]